MRRLLLAPALVLIAGVGLAAQEPAAKGEPVFRSGASLVALNVSVTDGAGKRFVTDLSQRDFAVFEDGVRQEVRFFESSQVPVDLILLLDTSSSMADKMATVHEAAVGFLRTLRAVDRGAVVAFNDGVQILQPLTGDRAGLEKAVRQTTAGGGTALNNALYIALREFGGGAREASTLRRRAIAVLSDGEDTTSLVSFDDVMDLARKAGVCIYTIGLQSKPPLEASSNRRFLSQSQYSLKALAQETGAEAFFPADIVELQGVYGSIAQELSSQYSLGYSPVNARADGRFRTIVVQIVSRPELRPKARRGYTAEGVGPLPEDRARR